jgi:hypothetical protein
MNLTFTPASHVRDEGTIICIEGWDEAGEPHWVGCDRRPALDIIHALQSGEETEIEVDVAVWQLVGG